MNLHLEEVIKDITSPDLPTARDATVRATLVLEWDHRGYWDRGLAEGFPQPGLYEAVHEPQDIEAFIVKLGELVRKQDTPNEIRLSIISAITKTRRLSVFPTLLKILDESPDFRQLCEQSDALDAIGSFLKDDSLTKSYVAELRRLAPRLVGFTLPDLMAEEARKLIVEAEGTLF